MDEFLPHGHVMTLESEALGERHFLDVRMMPSGDAYISCLLAEMFEVGQSSSPVDPARNKRLRSWSNL